MRGFLEPSVRARVLSNRLTGYSLARVLRLGSVTLLTFYKLTHEKDDKENV